MAQKLHIGILFGGKSTEHEISLLSARSIVEAIDRTKYDVSLIGIDQKGQWYLNENNNKISIDSIDGRSLALFPGNQANSLKLVAHNSQPLPRKIDVIFPVLHGTYGEDGAIQGLLKLVNLPFVGAGVLGSAVGMDKDVMKRLLRDAGIQIPKFLVFHRQERSNLNFEEIKNHLGFPFFVKPANTGSSVGINKVSHHSHFDAAINEAFKYDHKILIEEFISGREIECAVLGNNNPIASILGEIIPHHEFYSYEAKYLDENGATLQIPAEVENGLATKIQQLAIDAFKILCCQGMARVDFFLRKDGEIFVNEINTIPGFTSISMYPRLWAASGVGYSELIDRLINLAIEQFQEANEIHTDFVLPKNNDL